MKKVAWYMGILFLFLSLSTYGAWGQEKNPFILGKPGDQSSQSKQPVRITSQKLEADNKNMIIIFSGNVVAKQGEMIIYSDVAQVYYQKKGEANELREIIATGNVKYQQGDQFASGQKAVFTNGEQKIILTGQPKAWQGKNVITGEKITLFLEEDKSIVESSPERRVEVILYPQNESGIREKP